MTIRLLKTPFHPRTAAQNSANEWSARGGFTVPAVFGAVAHEAVAARHSAILADVTPYSRLWVRGSGAAKLLSAACGFNSEALPEGQARPVFWKTDAGAVRGTGVLARFGDTAFLLGTMCSDVDWFAAAAPRFGAELFDETRHRGVLLVAGPAAPHLLSEAGLVHAARLEPMRQAVVQWRGVTVTVSRWLHASGYEIACAPSAAIEIFDGLQAAGRRYGLVLAGQEALELLFLEEGVPVPGLDFAPARDDDLREPSPAAFGLTHGMGAGRVLAGVEWDGEEGFAPQALFRPVKNHAPAGFTPEFLVRLEHKVGDILRAAYSPALRRMIALAMIERECAAPATELILRRAGRHEVENIPARVVRLPFLI